MLKILGVAVFLLCVLLYFGVLYFVFALFLNRNMVHNVLFDYKFYGHKRSYNIMLFSFSVIICVALP